jgi:hypothetical protein
MGRGCLLQQAGKTREDPNRVGTGGPPKGFFGIKARPPAWKRERKATARLRFKLRTWGTRRFNLDYFFR